MPSDPNTAKVRMEIELEYDTGIMHGDDADSRRWFFEEVLGGGQLLLHSNEIGDTVGEVRLIRIIEDGNDE
jgi:hypothetical protein